MRELTNIRAWIAVGATMGVAVVARHRKQAQRRRLRPRVTPLRLIHPDEIENLDRDLSRIA